MTNVKTGDVFLTKQHFSCEAIAVFDHNLYIKSDRLIMIVGKILENYVVISCEGIRFYRENWLLSDIKSKTISRML